MSNQYNCIDYNKPDELTFFLDVELAWRGKVAYGHITCACKKHPEKWMVIATDVDGKPIALANVDRGGVPRFTSIP